MWGIKSEEQKVKLQIPHVSTALRTILRGKGGEMTQTLYAYMNKINK
jgi:hypothetical protein